MQYSEAQLNINYSHLKNNIQWMREKTESDFVCPMVKANAYGVGAVLVSQALVEMGIQYLGVVRISEARDLREHGIGVDLLLFNAFTEKDLEQIEELKLSPVVSSLEQLKILKKYLQNKSKTMSVHLEFDTGMNRLGFRQEEVSRLLEALGEAPEVKVAGVFSHLLEASDWSKENQRSQQQYEKFKELAARFPHAQAHLASSKALGEVAKKFKYGIRPGLWLYGIDAKDTPLKPVLQLEAPVIHLKTVPQGESVSYSGLWTAQRDSLVATLPLGYGDGYSRRLSGQAEVLFKGQWAPVVGAVCMDFLMVDVTGLEKKPQLGDLVTLLGPSPCGEMISIESLAQKCDVIPYEFICGLSQRLQRRWVGRSE